MTPPKPPGLIPDPELPADREEVAKAPKRRRQKDEPRRGEPTKDLPRESPPMRGPRPKDHPHESPDEVEW